MCKLQNWRCWGAPPKLLVCAHAQQPCLTRDLISKTDRVNSGYESVKARQVSYSSGRSPKNFLGIYLGTSTLKFLSSSGASAWIHESYRSFEYGKPRDLGATDFPMNPASKTTVNT